MTLDKHYMSKEQAYASFKAYEQHIDAQVASGRMPLAEARKHIELSKKNYSRLNLNRELDKAKK